METAMEELIKRVLRNGQYIPIELQTEMLEKEKKQIMNAVGLKKSTKKDIFGNNRIITLTPEEYYNETYNTQNK